MNKTVRLSFRACYSYNVNNGVIILKTVKNSNRVLLYIGRFLIISGITVLSAAIIFDCWIRPSLERLIEYRCTLFADRAVSRAICDHLLTSETDYSDIVSFVYDADGNIGALRTNPTKINTMKAAIMDLVNSRLSEMGTQKISIAIGSLTGISYLYGTGVQLSFSVKPTGVARSQLISRFESTGINQTMHSVILVVKTEISPVIPGLSDSFFVDNEFVIAQTVIVGEVPDTFSNIVLDEDHYSELADISLT